MFVKATAAQIRFLLKRNSAILTFFILLAMVLFNFISNVLAFQGKDVVEMYHPMKLLLLSWNQTYLTPDRTLNFIQLYPLLVVCPAGFALASERQTGEDILLAAKLGNIRYRFSKILAAFAVTMIVFTIPFLDRDYSELSGFSAVCSRRSDESELLSGGIFPNDGKLSVYRIVSGFTVHICCGSHTFIWHTFRHPGSFYSIYFIPVLHEVPDFAVSSCICTSECYHYDIGLVPYAEFFCFGRLVQLFSAVC